MREVHCKVCGFAVVAGLGHVPGIGTDYLCSECLSKYPPLRVVLGLTA